MNLSKYIFLYDYIPSLKQVIENKKLTFKQRKSLKIISMHYGKKFLKSSNKKILRKKIKLRKLNISITELKKKSLLLSEMILNSNEYKKAKSIFCYISFEDEIDTFKILENSLNNNKILSVPVIKTNRGMISAIITSLDNLEKNKYGILEPINYQIIDKNDIDLAIVPGLGYNPLGYRIGYGRGYYDIFLKDFKGLSIGMVLKDFLIQGLVPEKFDIPVKKLFIQ